jgi:triacylglycerol lipase
VPTRLAPENPFPAAVHDSWEALLWLQTTGHSLLHLDLSKAAIGGSSAGGNLTATMCHKAVAAPPSLVPKFQVQLLIVPVTDNTADASNTLSWKENEFVPALPAAKMLWYRNHYLPEQRLWAHPEASPLLYEEGLAEQPRALIVMGELDVLRTEGERYAEKLRGAGVHVDVKIMKGMPHPFLAMDGAIQQGRDTISYMVEALQEAFGRE